MSQRVHTSLGGREDYAYKNLTNSSKQHQILNNYGQQCSKNSREVSDCRG